MAGSIEQVFTGGKLREDSMDEQRKYAILFAATSLAAVTSASILRKK